MKHTEHKHGTSSPVSRPRLEVADIFREFGEAYRKRYILTPDQERLMRNIETCRTAALGGHLDRCTCCSFARPSYNSCCNRNCPKCGGLQQAIWVNARIEKMLPVLHFHATFPLPSELRPLTLLNRNIIYGLLLKSAADTLLKLGRDKKRLGAQPGMTGVLHSWSRDIGFHPHACHRHPKIPPRAA